MDHAERVKRQRAPLVESPATGRVLLLPRGTVCGFCYHTWQSRSLMVKFDGSSVLRCRSVPTLDV